MADNQLAYLTRVPDSTERARLIALVETVRTSLMEVVKDNAEPVLPDITSEDLTQAYREAESAVTPPPPAKERPRRRIAGLVAGISAAVAVLLGGIVYTLNRDKPEVADARIAPTRQVTVDEVRRGLEEYTPRKSSPKTPRGSTPPPAVKPAVTTPAAAATREAQKSIIPEHPPSGTLHLPPAMAPQLPQPQRPVGVPGPKAAVAEPPMPEVKPNWWYDHIQYKLPEISLAEIEGDVARLGREHPDLLESREGWCTLLEGARLLEGPRRMACLVAVHERAVEENETCMVLETFRQMRNMHMAVDTLAEYEPGHARVILDYLPFRSRRDRSFSKSQHIRRCQIADFMDSFVRDALMCCDFENASRLVERAEGWCGHTQVEELRRLVNALRMSLPKKEKAEQFLSGHPGDVPGSAKAHETIGKFLLRQGLPDKAFPELARGRKSPLQQLALRSCMANQPSEYYQVYQEWLHFSSDQQVARWKHPGMPMYDPLFCAGKYFLMLLDGAQGELGVQAEKELERNSGREWPFYPFEAQGFGGMKKALARMQEK